MRAHLASLVEDFRRHAAETAVVANRGNRRYPKTYGELAHLAGRFSEELNRRAIAPGDRVILWGQNSAEWIAAFFGCLLRGVIAVPLDAAGSSEFAARIVADVTPKLIVGDADLLRTLRFESSPNATSFDLSHLAFSDLQDVLPREPLFAVSEAVSLQTPFQIVFTSGTTAEPRGIVHTHRNVLVTLEPIESEIAKYRRYERWVHPLRLLHSLPLSHVFGQFMGLWIPALLAAEVHFAEQLEPSRIAGLIRRERISVLVAVPRIQQLLRTHLLARFPALAGEVDRAAGLPIWKRWWRLRAVHRALGWKFWAVISGGATLPPELETFWSRLGLVLIQGYGMTETSALVTLNHPFHIVQGSIGKPLPGREVKIGEDGEILVRGEMLAGATWQGGQMRPRTDEWLATGDLAERSATGELRFLGRKGDFIVSGAGMNVHPADLEAAMAKQAGVRGCVVVPCHFSGGDQPVAVVIFPGGEEQLQAAVTLANRGLAEYQQIRRTLRWPELQFPFTSTGKLIRRQVAQWACAALSGQKQPDSPAAASERDVLLEVITEVTGEAIRRTAGRCELRLTEDLHLDSLGRVQLQSALEQRFGLELEDDAIAAIETIGELQGLIEGSLGGSAQAGVPRQVPDTWDDGGRTSSLAAADAPSAAVKAKAGSSVEALEEHAYPLWPWTWPVQALRVGFIELIVRPLVWLLGAPRVERETGEIPAGPLLVIANHVTAYDGALILYALPAKLRRRMAVAMSGEMLLDLRRGRKQGNALANLFGPAGYWLVTALFNVFPLPRARGFRKSFAHAGKAMDCGYAVLIFPEGTRSRDGRLNRFRPGIGLLGSQSRIPILPVALLGLYELRAGQSSNDRIGWFRSGKLGVRVGCVVQVADQMDPARLTETLERELRGLLGDAAEKAESAGGQSN